MFESDYSESVDIYAFGLCVLEMVTGRGPFAESAGFGPTLKCIETGKLPENMHVLKHGWPEAYAFVLRCLTPRLVESSATVGGGVLGEPPELPPLIARATAPDLPSDTEGGASYLPPPGSPARVSSFPSASAPAVAGGVESAAMDAAGRPAERLLPPSPDPQAVALASPRRPAALSPAGGAGSGGGAVAASRLRRITVDKGAGPPAGALHYTRPTALELLSDPFLLLTDEDNSSGRTTADVRAAAERAGAFVVASPSDPNRARNAAAPLYIPQPVAPGWYVMDPASPAASAAPLAEPESGAPAPTAEVLAAAAVAAAREAARAAAAVEAEAHVAASPAVVRSPSSTAAAAATPVGETEPVAVTRAQTPPPPGPPLQDSVGGSGGDSQHPSPQQTSQPSPQASAGETGHAAGGASGGHAVPGADGGGEQSEDEDDGDNGGGGTGSAARVSVSRSHAGVEEDTGGAHHAAAAAAVAATELIVSTGGTGGGDSVIAVTPLEDARAAAPTAAPPQPLSALQSPPRSQQFHPEPGHHTAAATGEAPAPLVAHTGGAPHGVHTDTGGSGGREIPQHVILRDGTGSSGGGAAEQMDAAAAYAVRLLPAQLDGAVVRDGVFPGGGGGTGGAGEAQPVDTRSFSLANSAARPDFAAAVATGQSTPLPLRQQPPSPAAAAVRGEAAGPDPDATRMATGGVDAAGPPRASLPVTATQGAGNLGVLPPQAPMQQQLPGRPLPLFDVDPPMAAAPPPQQRQQQQQPPQLARPPAHQQRAAAQRQQQQPAQQQPSGGPSSGGSLASGPFAGLPPAVALLAEDVRAMRNEVHALYVMMEWLVSNTAGGTPWLNDRRERVQAIRMRREAAAGGGSGAAMPMPQRAGQQHAAATAVPWSAAPPSMLQPGDARSPPLESSGAPAGSGGGEAGGSGGGGASVSVSARGRGGAGAGSGDDDGAVGRGRTQGAGGASGGRFAAGHKHHPPVAHRPPGFPYPRQPQPLAARPSPQLYPQQPHVVPPEIEATRGAVPLAQPSVAASDVSERVSVDSELPSLKQSGPAGAGQARVAKPPKQVTFADDAVGAESPPGSRALSHGDDTAGLSGASPPDDPSPLAAARTGGEGVSSGAAAAPPAAAAGAASAAARADDPSPAPVQSPMPSPTDAAATTPATHAPAPAAPAFAAIGPAGGGGGPAGPTLESVLADLESPDWVAPIEYHDDVTAPGGAPVPVDDRLQAKIDAERGRLRKMQAQMARHAIAQVSELETALQQENEARQAALEQEAARHGVKVREFERQRSDMHRALQPLLTKKASIATASATAAEDDGEALEGHGDALAAAGEYHSGGGDADNAASTSAAGGALLLAQHPTHGPGVVPAPSPAPPPGAAVTGLSLREREQEASIARREELLKGREADEAAEHEKRLVEINSSWDAATRKLLSRLRQVREQFHVKFEKQGADAEQAIKVKKEEFYASQQHPHTGEPAAGSGGSNSAASSASPPGPNRTGGPQAAPLTAGHAPSIGSGLAAPDAATLAPVPQALPTVAAPPAPAPPDVSTGQPLRRTFSSEAQPTASVPSPEDPFAGLQPVVAPERPDAPPLFLPPNHPAHAAFAAQSSQQQQQQQQHSIGRMQHGFTVGVGGAPPQPQHYGGGGGGGSLSAASLAHGQHRPIPSFGPGGVAATPQAPHGAAMRLASSSGGGLVLTPAPPGGPPGSSFLGSPPLLQFNVLPPAPAATPAPVVPLSLLLPVSSSAAGPAHAASETPHAHLLAVAGDPSESLGMG